jgi:hypothetical protein
MTGCYKNLNNKRFLLNNGNQTPDASSLGIIKIYKIIILKVVLYGCGTWFLTFREEHTLMVFENRVLTA